MKYLFQCITAGLLTAVLASIPVARAQHPVPGPDRLALQKWYLFSQTQPAPLFFNKIQDPCGMAFDGENMWVGDYIGQSVTRIRAADAAVIRVYPLTLTYPCPMAFDGANIWVSTNVARSSYGTVTKIQPDGKIVTKTFPPPGRSAIAFDGANIWVSSNLAPLKLSPEGEVVGNSPGAIENIVFDGSSLWATELGGLLKEIRPSDGAVLKTYDHIGDSFNFTGLVFDGTYLWIARVDGVIAKVRRSDGAVLGTFTVGQVPQLGFDGRNVWAISLLPGSLNSVSVWRADTGEQAGSFTLPGNTAQVFAFDGTSMWIGGLNGIFKF